MSKHLGTVHQKHCFLTSSGSVWPISWQAVFWNKLKPLNAFFFLSERLLGNIQNYVLLGQWNYSVTDNSQGCFRHFPKIALVWCQHLAGASQILLTIGNASNSRDRISGNCLYISAATFSIVSIVALMWVYVYWFWLLPQLSPVF